MKAHDFDPCGRMWSQILNTLRDTPHAVKKPSNIFDKHSSWELFFIYSDLRTANHFLLVTLINWCAGGMNFPRAQSKNIPRSREPSLYLKLKHFSLI